MLKAINILLFFIIFIFLPFIPVMADSSFNHNYIISDYDMTNYQSMNLEEIQKFLQESNGILGSHKTYNTHGKEMLASKIIYQASQEYSINPQVILTLIQKEQTLISRIPLKDSQLDWATGFGAYDGRRPVQRFKGFGVQIDRAAWRLRYFLEHPWEFRYKAGQTYRIDWHKVMPQNSATAALYNYTPHLKGNELFWKVWQKWFTKQDGEFPEGSLLRANNESGVWLIQNTKRRPFHSKNVFLMNYNFKDINVVDKSDIEVYEIGRPVTFPNYSLVQSSLGNIFMLVYDYKRPISEKIFRAIGFHPEEIIEVDDSDLNSYKMGTEIISPYPSGALLQDNESYSVYYVKENTKYPIVDIKILDNNFPYSSIIKVNAEELVEFETGPHIKFRDGTLIKASDNPTVYVISEEKRLPIFSEEIFESLGYRWKSIITISDVVLNMHSLGDILKIE